MPCRSPPCRPSVVLALHRVGHALDLVVGRIAVRKAVWRDQVDRVGGPETRALRRAGRAGIQCDSRDWQRWLWPLAKVDAELAGIRRRRRFAGSGTGNWDCRRARRPRSTHRRTAAQARVRRCGRRAPSAAVGRPACRPTTTRARSGRCDLPRQLALHDTTRQSNTSQLSSGHAEVLLAVRRSESPGLHSPQGLEYVCMTRRNAERPATRVHC